MKRENNAIRLGAHFLSYNAQRPTKDTETVGACIKSWVRFVQVTVNDMKCRIILLTSRHWHLEYGMLHC